MSYVRSFDHGFCMLDRAPVNVNPGDVFGFQTKLGAATAIISCLGNLRF